jgi:glutaredoxin
MVLYTCRFGTSHGNLGPFSHPCGRAGKALADAGFDYETRRVEGGSLMFWTWPSRAEERKEVEELSGQRAVPILVLEGGEVIAGSGEITRWARSAARAEPPAS